MKSFL
jgi:hypothetical protein